MSTKRRMTLYFPEPEENELWEAIERLPKGARGLIIRDIVKTALLGETPRTGFLVPSAGNPVEEIKEEPQQKEPEVDKKVLLDIPIFKG